MPPLLEKKKMVAYFQHEPLPLETVGYFDERHVRAVADTLSRTGPTFWVGDLKWNPPSHLVVLLALLNEIAYARVVSGEGVRGDDNRFEAVQALSPFSADLNVLITLLRQRDIVRCRSAGWAPRPGLTLADVQDYARVLRSVGVEDVQDDPVVINARAVYLQQMLGLRPKTRDRP